MAKHTIFDQLREEHGEVERMMRQVATSEDPEVRRALFPTIRRELIAHAKGEEREFYSVLRRHEETRELAEHALDEHEDIEEMLGELEAMAFDSDEWGETFEELVDSVKDHVDVEENDLFPMAKRLLSEAQTHEIEERYEERKNEVLAQLSPAAE